MRLEPLCALDLHYTSDFHLARPYGNEFDLTGRTVFVDRQAQEVGRQPLMVQLESEDDRDAWLNNAVCVGEGIISAETLMMHMEVYRCVSEL